MEPIGRYDTTAILEKSLPILEESHRVLANNVANANTPGFSPTHVSFKESLRLALAGAGDRSLQLETTDPRHIASSDRPSMGVVFEPDEFEQGRNDKSEFNIDKEMIELLRNSGRFEIFSTALTQRYRQTREVLRMP